MNARAGLSHRVSLVLPAWLEPRLGAPGVSVLDVRSDDDPRQRDDRDESGPRLRTAATIELGPFAHLGAAAGWRASKTRYRSRPGAPRIFTRGHLPGAVSLDVRAQLFDEAGVVVTAPELAMAMSRLGVGDGHTVVLVDGAGPQASLAAAWVLARYGHDRVHVLDGGFPRWAREGRAISRVPARPVPASFTARTA